MPAMQGRSRIASQRAAGRAGRFPAARWLAARSTRAPSRIRRGAAVGRPEPAARQLAAPLTWPAPQELGRLLEGFCPEPVSEEQIAVNSGGGLLFLRLADIGWLEGTGDGVAVHVGAETHVLRNTLAALAAKLPPDRFLWLSPSTVVNLGQIQELRPLCDGDWRVVLRNGTRLTVRRGCCEHLRRIGVRRCR